jgi:DNA gyrase subunit A
VLRSCIALIEDPDITTARLWTPASKVLTFHSAARSSPTARRCKIYEDGQGSIRIQGEWKLEAKADATRRSSITSIPYNVDRSSRMKSERLLSRAVPQLTGQTNETNEKEGWRRARHQAGDRSELVMVYLYKHTTLQQNFAFNMTRLVPSAMGPSNQNSLDSRGSCQHFLDFRLATVRKRRFEYELAQLRRASTSSTASGWSSMNSTRRSG